MRALRRFLPGSYLEGFADPGARASEPPFVWVHRPAFGAFQAAPLEPDGTNRHFNEVDEPALGKNQDLERLLEAVEDGAALELNARTLVRARRFVLAPKPAVPG